MTIDIKTSKKNIFVIGYEPFNAELLNEPPVSKNMAFHSLLSYEELKGAEDVPAKHLLQLAIQRIEDSQMAPDAIITYWDFPATILCAILNTKYGLNGPTPRSVFKCEHKGWSRAEQKKVIADHIPICVTFDPNEDSSYEHIQLLPPFWIKPVKSLRSWLSFKVTDRTDFESYRQTMRTNVDSIYAPFVDLMRFARVSDVITNSTESCIAESCLEGHMCTLEGYVYDSDVTVYGIVDSIREKDLNSFQRYQYPSQLPMEIQFRLADITKRVIERIDLNDTCFNIEFFYNQTSDTIQLLEINPRTSQSHADLFSKVHGHSQFQILLEIALNKRPMPMPRDGKYRMACKYMHRINHTGVVKAIPSEQTMSDILEKYPDTKIELLIKEGQNLDDLLFQDSYSYEIANIYIGGHDEFDIEEKYQDIIAQMAIIVEPKIDDLTTATDNTKIEELVLTEAKQVESKP